MKNKSTLTFILFLTAIFFLTQNNVNAQEHNIYEVSDYSLNKTTNKKNDKSRFYDLVFKKHPTHYINDKKLKSNSKSIKPLKLNLGDTESFNWFLKGKYEKDNVELLIMTLDNREELNNSIDVSTSNEFKKLKYVLIKCNFNCSNEDILKFVKANSNVRVFYLYNLPQ